MLRKTWHRSRNCIFSASTSTATSQIPSNNHLVSKYLNQVNVLFEFTTKRQKMQWILTLQGLQTSNVSHLCLKSNCTQQCDFLSNMQWTFRINLKRYIKTHVTHCSALLSPLCRSSSQQWGTCTWRTAKASPWYTPSQHSPPSTTSRTWENRFYE